MKTASRSNEFVPTAIEIIVISVTLIAAGFLVNWKVLLQGIIFEGHDLWIHVNWLQHFHDQLQEGIWYPRWLANTNYGYGSPTFVFYPPFVFYIGSLFKILGFNGERSIALLFFFSVLLAGVAFYLYMRHKKLSVVAASFGAMLYMAAPYMIYNIYNRGALPETWAFYLSPLGLYLTERSLHDRRWCLPLSLCFTVLALTHVPSLLLLTIFWFSYLLIVSRAFPWKSVAAIALSAIIGFGIASPYLLPAIFEQPWVNIQSMRDYTGGYREHFLEIGGNYHLASIYRYALASAFAFTGISVVLSWLDRNSSRLYETLTWFCYVVVFAYLMSPLSKWFWDLSSTLQMVQFPWRLLSLLSMMVAGLGSFAMASTYESLRRRRPNLPRRAVAVVALITLTLVGVGNVRYSYIMTLRYPGFYQFEEVSGDRAEPNWQAESYGKIRKAISGSSRQNLEDVREHWPIVPDTKTVAESPKPNREKVEVEPGQASVDIESWQSYDRELLVRSPEPVYVKLRTYYYPAWQLLVDGNPHPVEVAKDGTIGLHLEQGNHNIRLQYRKTAAYKLGLAISGACIVLILYLSSVQKRKI